MFLKSLLGACLGLAAVSAVAQCYTVYDRDNRVVYQGRESPVDMSWPLHVTVPGYQPGGHLVFDNITVCQEIRQEMGPAQRTSGSPPASSLAGDASDETRRMGGPAAPPRPRERVITELRNPPLRVVQENGQLTIESLDSRDDH